MAKAQERIGEQIGEYRLQRYLGRGSFGAVYLAEHLLHKQAQVAIKLLHTPLTTNDDWQHFLNEARGIRLQHPHIIPLLDFGISHEETPYLVMEYAAGGTLKERYKRANYFPLSTIATYALQIASALQYAHDRRLIHRDVKPENMLLRADGTVLLSDFGIARILEQTSTLTHPTHAGTPAYMAPEQAKGHPCPASDQYALAVVMYEWIAGRRPFLGAPIEVAIQHQLEPPPALHILCPHISFQVEQVLTRALAKKPEARFENVARFAQELQQALKDLDTEATFVRRLPFASAKPTGGPFSTEQLLPTTLAAHEAEKVAQKPGVTSGVEETTKRLPPPNTQTPVPSLVNPLPDSPVPLIPQPEGRRLPQRRSIYWRVGAILLLVGLLTGGGTWYILAQQNHPSQKMPLASTQVANISEATSTSTAKTPAATVINATPTATSTAERPTPTTSTAQASSPPVPQGWYQVLNDPMTANQHNSAWNEGNTCTFLAHEYEVQSLGSNYCSYGDASHSSTNFGDLYYSMDISIRQGSQAGIIFRNQKDNYYYFSITLQGAYALSFHASANGGQDTTIASGHSTAIYQGLDQWNALTVIARGSSISLFINNVSMGTAADATRSQGSVGVAVNGPDSQTVSADVWFKDASVWIP